MEWDGDGVDLCEHSDILFYIVNKLFVPASNIEQRNKGIVCQLQLSETRIISKLDNN